jgi:hypothetical protein
MAKPTTEASKVPTRLPSTGLKAPRCQGAKQDSQVEQDSQVLGARLASTGAKIAKVAKMANALVTVVTQLTIVTDAEPAMMRTVRGSVSLQAVWCRGKGEAGWKTAK